MTPALWTCVGLLALVAIVCGAQAGRNVPAKWADLQSFELVPLTAVELFQERTGSFATAPVSHGKALLLARERPTPPALSSALSPLSTNWALPIHADLKLGFSRIRALNHNRTPWTVNLFAKQVVRIASANGELLRYGSSRTPGSTGAGRWLHLPAPAGWPPRCWRSCLAASWPRLRHAPGATR